MPVDLPPDCTTQYTDEELRSPMSLLVAGIFLYLYPGDEPWRVRIHDRPRWYRTGWVWGPRAERKYSPFGERRGFKATLTCGDTQRVLDGLECETEDGVVLYVAGQEVGYAGEVDEPCELRIELRDDDGEWVYIEDNILVRPGLRERFF